MKNNNKGLLDAYGLVLGGAIIIIFSLFTSIFIFNVMKDEMITPLNDVIQNDLSTEVSATTLTNIQDVHDFSINYTFAFDLFFLLMFFYIVYKLFEISLTSPKLSKSKFIIALFGNFLFSGMVIFYIGGFIEWFATYFLINYFGLTMPFFDFFISNVGMILFILINITLIINQLSSFIVEGRIAE